MLVLAAAACGADGTPGTGSGGTGGTGGAGGQAGGAGGSGGEGGAPMGGTVGPSGGNVDRLAFVVFGDVRPPTVGFDLGYPTGTLTQILTRAAATPAEFGLGTGDYMYSDTAASVAAQLDKLVAAERAFGRPIFHAMGNHECTGATASNCPNGTETPNVRGFLMTLVPFSPRPYYSLTVTTSLGDAKFVILAANAWDDAQQSWLQTELARPTEYTFVVRHEPSSAYAPGVGPSDAIMAAHPLTAAFYGHYHEYRQDGANAVISGNAGAPIHTGSSFGFVYVLQRTDGNVVIEEHRMDDDAVLDRFVLTKTGERTQ